MRGAFVQNEKKLRITATSWPQVAFLLRGIVRTKDDEIRRHDSRADVQRARRASLGRALFGIDFRDYFAEDLRRLSAPENEALVRASDQDVIEATPVGELFLRNLAMCFDRYWREKHEGSEKPVFSRTV